MKLQMDFTDPLKISKGTFPAAMSLKIKNPDWFVSESSGKKYVFPKTAI